MAAGGHMLALVVDAFGGHGGIAQYNRDFLAAAVRLGAVRGIVVLPRSAPDHFATPRGLIQLRPRPARIAYAARALAAALWRRPGIVFCGHLHLAPLAWLVARLRGARLVVQLHGVEAWARASRLRRAAIEAADLVLCVSRHTRRCVLGWAAVAPERVLVVPNTVADVFVPGDSSAFRTALGLDRQRILLTVGRMDRGERYKGHERVIAAIPALVRHGHDVVYAVAGDGDDRPRLEVLARESGAADRVRFLGAISKKALAEAYRGADLFVMPSTGEGFGIAYLEAMASGTRALGLDAGGARDPLAASALGTVAPASVDLAETIAHLLDRPQRDVDRLAADVRTRFGRAAFRDRVRLALDRVLAPA
jgi:phosphatidylinositol alpha-1,6-mannosyltransferase